ncbi:MAG: hypothetical protein QNK30_11795 [Bacteroidales bacterium]|nr:hypothetical protein [Bacteroidales bacterium]
MQKHIISRIAITCLLVIVLLIFPDCSSIGTKKIARDRFEYSHELGESWKKQMLLNIIKVRYLELPIFLDIGQIVSGYSMETSVNMGGTFTGVGPVGSLGAQGRYTDRPTITYRPLTGERFLEGFLTPLRPVNVFSLVQSGYEADVVLELCLDSFNGLHNRSASLASNIQPDPEFFEVLRLMREVQGYGGFGIRNKESEDGETSYIIYFRNDLSDKDIRSKGAEIRRLLNIPMDVNELELVYTPTQGAAGELGVGTRSLWQILAAMSMGILIPEEHRQKNIVPPLTEVGLEEDALLRVFSGDNKPDESYVSVEFKDKWFWIEDSDWKSKNTFSSILFLFTLAGSDGGQQLPTITIPTF